MRLRRLIKKNAALALRRHWCRAAAISLITMIFWAVFATLEQFVMLAFNVQAYVEGFSAAVMDNLPNTAPIAMAVMILVGMISFFAIIPLMLGATRWFYYLTDGRALATIGIFEYFFSAKGYFKALWFEVVLAVKKLFWTLLFIAPPTAMIMAGNYWRQQASRNIETLLSVGIEIFGGVLLLLLFWFWFIWIQRYTLARYILVSDDSLTVGKAVKYSVQLSSGRLTELMLLELSLIGWRITEILVIPRLFTVPYINTIRSLYARYLTELYQRDMKEQARQQAEYEAEQTVEKEEEPPEESPEEVSEETTEENIAEESGEETDA